MINPNNSLEDDIKYSKIISTYSIMFGTGGIIDYILFKYSNVDYSIATLLCVVILPIVYTWIISKIFLSD